MASQRLKMRTMKSDGSKSSEPFDIEIVHPETGERILDEKKEPCVVVNVRPMLIDEWRGILKSKETVGKDDLTGQVQRQQNFEEAVDELCIRCINTWRGLDGADDQPLVCNNSTKPHLPAPVKNQIWRRVLGAEVVAAVDRSSFREPADLS